MSSHVVIGMNWKYADGRKGWERDGKGREGMDGWMNGWMDEKGIRKFKPPFWVLSESNSAFTRLQSLQLAAEMSDSET